MENSKNRKVWQIVIAVLTAIVLWVYVDNQVATDAVLNVKGVPVEFSGEDTTLAGKNLMLLSGYDTTIDLKLEGPRRVLWQMNTDAIRIVADTGSIDSTGVQTLSYSIVYPDNVSRSSVSVKSASAYTVTVTVGELYTKEVPVYCDVNGEVAEGYFAGDLQIDTTTLVLHAQREDLLNVSYAKVEVNAGGATRTLIQALEYTLYDYNDVPVVNSNIRSATKLVQITLPVRTMKVIPLQMELVGTPEDGADNVQYDINPATVQVIGEEDTLTVIDSIVLDRIYVEDLASYQTFNYDIKVPVGTALAENTPKVAIVTVIVNSAKEAVLNVEEITCENVADHLKASVDAPIDITVWGQSGAVDILDAADVQVRVDLSEVTEVGTYELPAVITLDSNRKVAVKGSYTVSVTVTERDNEQSSEGTET